MAEIRRVTHRKSIHKKIVKGAPDLDFDLPRELSPISDDIMDYMIVISGLRKIGKTTLFQGFQDPFFVMCDRNAGLALFQKRITRWEQFLKIIEILENEPDYCGIVIIDTGFTLYEFCFKYVMDDLGITDPKDKGWGVVWKVIFKHFYEAHERIIEAGFGLGVIAHSEDKERPDGGSTKKAKLSAQAYTYYTGLADVLAHYQYNPDTGDRELIITGSAEVDAGTNIDYHFKYTNGSAIKTIPMGSNKDQSYKNFMLAFNNKLIAEKSFKKTSGSFKKKVSQ